MNNGFITLSIFAAVVAFFYASKARATVNDSELDSMSHKHNGSGVSALAADWARVNNFYPGEFQDQLECLDRNVVYALQKLRNKIGRIDISKASGAIARTDSDSKNSMHYCGFDNGKKRLSVAIDIHPVDVDLKAAYEVAKTIPEFGAVGVYPNWNTPGLHIDLRHRKSDYTIASWSDIGHGPDHNYVSVKEAFV